MQQRDDEIPLHKIPVLPDRELLVWEKWIRIRREETTSLGKKLERPPADLAMNLLDKVREDKERKTALEHAQIEKKTGARGSLWDRPPRLKQRCYCDPAYELHRTTAEKGNPGMIEHIGVPSYIKQNEMGMAGERLRVQCKQLNADYENYRQLREYDLHAKLLKIDPFRPDIKGLIVKGNNPPPPPPKMPPVPEIKIEEPTNEPEDPLRGVYALKINNTVFYKDIPGQNMEYVRSFRQKDRCSSWTYYFNVPMKRAGRSKLYLQNLGTVTLRYCWKKIKRSIPFIAEDAFEQVFFFNKNEDVISPGQYKEIFFTFISDKPGIYTEFWELSMANVLFIESGDKFLVNLYADSVEDIDMIKRKVEVLKTRIHRKAVNNFVLEFVEKIVDNVFEVVPQIYPYKQYFLEAEMFVLKNPVCFYHQTEVAKIKELYTEMVPGEVWDLSIGTWRKAMMEKEFDDRMKYYELFRQSHAEFLKPWYEGDGLIKEKQRNVKFLLGQLADKFDKEYVNLFDEYSFEPPQTVATKGTLRSKSETKSLILDPITTQTVRNVFFLRIYDHISSTMEVIAGILSSLDLNIWIDFDFCRQ